MVKPFQFAKTPRIIFRNGALGQLPEHILRSGTRMVLVTGHNSFISSPHAGKFFSELSEKKIVFYHIPVQGEPSPEDIDGAVRSLTNEKIDLVTGIGGGSVLDAGKAISAMIGFKESVTRYLEGVGDLEHPGTKLPFIAVPTTSGTGSEATKNAVISRTGPGGFKKSLRHDNFVPDLALVDPELTISCPREITATSGMDCFTQLMEAYLSDKASEYTDALALKGLQAIKEYLLRVCADGNDAVARAGMSFAALTSGICLANAGLGTVHGFASSVGGLFDIPHGLVCGTLMAKANEVNLRELRKNSGDSPAMKKYITLGKLFLDEEGKTDAYYADGFVHFLHKLADDLCIPGLKRYGIKEADIPAICMITENKNNPVVLGQAELEEIIGSRIL